MLMTISPVTSESKATPPKPRQAADPFAETDLLPVIVPDDAVESIDLEKRLPFPEHMEGMAALRRHWKRVMKWF
jgi:hypothetical protein